MSSSTPSPTGRKSAQVRLFQSSPASPATSTGDASSSSGKSSSQQQQQQQQQQVKNKKKSNMSAFFATPPSQQPKHHHHHHHQSKASYSTPTIIPKIMRAPSSVSSTSSTAASTKTTTTTTAQPLLLLSPPSSSNENQTALTASSRSQSSKSPQRISHTSVSPSRNRSSFMMSVDTTTTTTTTSGDAQQSNVTTTSPMTKMLLRRETTTPTITTPSTTTTSANVTPDRSSKVNRALFTTASTTTPTSHRTSSSSGGTAAIDFMTKNHELNLDRVSQLLTNVTGAKKSESNNLLLVNEFHVVAVMGGRATGKSTLANMIANVTTVDGAMDDRRELHGPFEMSGAHELITCERKTRGIQLYVSSDRVLVLDCEALFMDGTGTGGSGSGGVGGGLEHHAMESEMMSLQLGLFLYSVCHVIVIPYLESSLDAHMLRFVRTLDNLKKGIPDLYQSAGPRILFTANDVISHRQGGKKQQQQFLLSPVDRLLPSHRMLTELHGYDVCVVPHDPSSEDKKLFRDKVFREIDRRFRGSEVEWLHACAKNWEVIRKNYFLSEYTRTVQRIYIST